MVGEDDESSLLSPGLASLRVPADNAMAGLNLGERGRGQEQDWISLIVVLESVQCRQSVSIRKADRLTCQP